MPCGRQCAFSSSRWWLSPSSRRHRSAPRRAFRAGSTPRRRSEEHTSELQSQTNLVCRLLLEKKKLKHVEHPLKYTKIKRHNNSASLQQAPLLWPQYLAQDMLRTDLCNARIAADLPTISYRI